MINLNRQNRRKIMKKKIGLTTKIMIGLLIGVVFGLIIKGMPAGYIKDAVLLGGILKILGTGFTTAIKMMVVPLVFVSLVCGASAMGDIGKLGRIGGKTMSFYLLTTALAITIALIVGKIVNPGLGLDMSNLITQSPTIGENKSVVDVILAMIPSNPVASLANADMLQIIIFALIMGSAMSIIGEKAEPVKKIFESANEICMKMVEMIMLLAPYGVFALVTNTFATVGIDAMFALGKYMFVVLFALLLQGTITYTGLLKLCTGLKATPFYKKFGKIAAVTFSTSSSNASLPVTMEEMEKMGVSKNIGAFTLPLGATINMDGTAIMQGAAAIFISQVYGIDLGMQDMMTIILTATLASVGTAGVPGVGMITLSMVLTSVGLPVEGIGLIMGIDRILDMCRTTINVMGDCACTLVVAKTENELDLDKYYSEKEVVASIS
jgi:Na+/H+-dicarboxylate symporter